MGVSSDCLCRYLKMDGELRPAAFALQHDMGREQTNRYDR